MIKLGFPVFLVSFPLQSEPLDGLKMFLAFKPILAPKWVIAICSVFTCGEEEALNVVVFWCLEVIGMAEEVGKW